MLSVRGVFQHIFWFHRRHLSGDSDGRAHHSSGLTSTREPEVCSRSPKSFMMFLHTLLRRASNGTREGISSNFHSRYDVFSHVTSKEEPLLPNRRFHHHGHMDHARAASKVVSFFSRQSLTQPPLPPTEPDITLPACPPFKSYHNRQHETPQARARDTSTTSTITTTPIRPVGFECWSPGTTRQRQTAVTVRDAPSRGHRPFGTHLTPFQCSSSASCYSPISLRFCVQAVGGDTCLPPAAFGHTALHEAH